MFVPQVSDNVTLPIHILLHGVYGSAWSWALRGGAHRTAQRLIERGLIRPAIVAMPSDGLWGDGSAYFTHDNKQFDRWIVDDVPLAIVETIEGASTDSPLCIGGLSMGGYGALMLGMRFADKFRAISSHSAITRLEEMMHFVEEPLWSYTSATDLPDVIDAVRAAQGKLPALRFDCGTEDPLLEGNRHLHRQLTDLGVSHQYHEFEGGHEWPYWRLHVEKSLRFFDRHV